MISGAGQKFSVDEILKKYDQREIFKLANMQVDFKDHKIRNPFRVDKRGGCWYSEYNGIIYFNDHSPNFYQDFLTCVDAVKLYKGFRSLTETCSYIAKQLKPQKHLNEIEESKIKKQHEIVIKIRPKKWTEENNYFSKYGVSISNLEKENVYLVDDYKCNSRRNPILLTNPFHDPKKVLTICYTFEGGRKQLYWPDQEFRFYNSCNSEDYFGQDIINSTDPYSDVFWTSGGKDYLCARYGLDLVSCGNISEKYNMSSQLLRNFSRGFVKNLYNIGDNDLAGIRALKRNRDENGAIPVFFKRSMKVKDISEAYEKYGKNKVLCYLKEFYKKTSHQSGMNS